MQPAVVTISPGLRFPPHVSDHLAIWRRSSSLPCICSYEVPLAGKSRNACIIALFSFANGSISGDGTLNEKRVIPCSEKSSYTSPIIASTFFVFVVCNGLLFSIFFGKREGLKRT